MSTPDPALEMALSLTVLRSRSVPRDLDQWRRRVGRKLPASARLSLEPPLTMECGPDLLDLIEAAFDQLKRKTAEETLGLTEELPGSFEVVARETDAVVPSAELTRAVQDYFKVAISPFFPQISACVKSDVELRARNMLSHGLEQLLARLARTCSGNPESEDVLLRRSEYHP